MEAADVLGKAEISVGDILEELSKVERQVVTLKQELLEHGGVHGHHLHQTRPHRVHGDNARSVCGFIGVDDDHHSSLPSNSAQVSQKPSTRNSTVASVAGEIASLGGVS